MKTASIVHKAFSANCKISADETRTVVACISSSAVDREGDVIVPQGLNSKDFEKNPVVMLSHNYFTLPVGKVTAIKRDEEKVTAKIRFADRPDDYPDDEEWVPDTLFSLYQQGAMNAFSIGFMPTDYRVANGADIRKYGDECKQVINRAKLLELSCVAIPCHQDAVTEMVSKGILTQAAVDKLFKAVEDEKPEPEDKADAGVEETVDAEEKALEPEPEAEKVVEKVPEKHVHREVETVEVDEVAVATKHIVVQVDPPAVPYVKHVHRFIEPHVDVEVRARKAVVSTVAKARGSVFSPS